MTAFSKTLCVWVSIPCVCLLPVEARRWGGIPWNGSYRPLWTTMLVLGTQPRSFAEAASVLKHRAIFPTLKILFLTHSIFVYQSSRKWSDRINNFICDLISEKLDNTFLYSLPQQKKLLCASTHPFSSIPGHKSTKSQVYSSYWKLWIYRSLIT